MNNLPFGGVGDPSVVSSFSLVHNGLQMFLSYDRHRGCDTPVERYLVFGSLFDRRVEEGVLSNDVDDQHFVYVWH